MCCYLKQWYHIVPSIMGNIFVASWSNDIILYHDTMRGTYTVFVDSWSNDTILSQVPWEEHNICHSLKQWYHIISSSAQSLSCLTIMTEYYDWNMFPSYTMRGTYLSLLEAIILYCIRNHEGNILIATWSNDIMHVLYQIEWDAHICCFLKQ